MKIYRNRAALEPAAEKKMKKVLNEVSEAYHKGIKTQILAFLSDSEETRRTAEIVSEVDGARQKVNAALLDYDTANLFGNLLGEHLAGRIAKNVNTEA